MSYGNVIADAGVFLAAAGGDGDVAKEALKIAQQSPRADELFERSEDVIDFAIECVNRARVLLGLRALRTDAE